MGTLGRHCVASRPQTELTLGAKRSADQKMFMPSQGCLIVTPATYWGYGAGDKIIDER